MLPQRPRLADPLTETLQRWRTDDLCALRKTALRYMEGEEMDRIVKAITEVIDHRIGVQ